MDTWKHIKICVLPNVGVHMHTYAKLNASGHTIANVERCDSKADCKG